MQVCETNIKWILAHRAQQKLKTNALKLNRSHAMHTDYLQLAFAQ